MPCYTLEGMTPVIHPSANVHPTAVLIGDVIIGAGVYIAPNAVLRGDFGRIEMREGSNLQDTCVVHSLPDFDCVIEENGHVGHGAVIHAARIGRNALVGMNAVVMDRAYIGENSIVAACSFVKIGLQLPSGVLAAGVPVKILRNLSADEMHWKSEGTRLYHDLTQRCNASMVEVAPLTAVQANRPRVQIREDLQRALSPMTTGA